MVDATRPPNRNHLLTIRNVHPPRCGESPQPSGLPNQRTYVGYFESETGGQSVIEIDRLNKTGRLRLGNLGWDNVITIVNGNVESEHVFTTAESDWITVCWFAATGDLLDDPEPVYDPIKLV